MSIEETDRMAPSADTAKGLVPLLHTLGDAAAPVCVDGFCEVPAKTAEATNVTQGADK